ncbi:MAG: hypothetical protein HYV26_10700, partial [Candidatus Hydrogenedentes bacterium]|nr:hypothetical protein [Candidatus Hydrogenedentota bacterium]
LIELLTVIAIIGILAGLTMTVYTKVKEKAKITRIESTMSQINTAMTQYFGQYNSYPPAYGYLSPNFRGETPVSGQDALYYFLKPYTEYIKIRGNEDMYDGFSDSYNTDGDASLNLLEFLPLGQVDLATNTVAFPSERYIGSNLASEVSVQLESSPRPLVYVPVNSRQFQIARKYWIQHADYLAENWDYSDANLQTLRFPPANYDAFVLISMGPDESAGGVVTGSLFELSNNAPINPASPDSYHLAALRTYFLATRDLNDNDALDFEFKARDQKDEGGVLYQIASEPPAQQNHNYFLPNGTALAGPLIYASK